MLDDIAENQFSLPTGVARIDKRIDIFAFDQAKEHFESRLAFLDGTQGKLRRNDRQMRKSPLASFDLDSLRRAQFKKMPNRRGQDETIAFKIVALTLKAASALAISAATDGFSAIINAFPMGFVCSIISILLYPQFRFRLAKLAQTRPQVKDVFRKMSGSKKTSAQKKEKTASG